MGLPDLNGSLAVFGGLTGFGVLVYMVLMVYFTREKDRHVQQLLERQVELMGRQAVLEAWVRALYIKANGEDAK